MSYFLCLCCVVILEGWLHILEKHGGKLPLRIRAVPEGSVVPVKNGEDKIHWKNKKKEFSLLKSVKLFRKLLIRQLCDWTILLIFIVKLMHYGLFSLIHSSKYRSRLSLVDKLGWGKICHFFSLYTKWTNVMSWLDNAYKQRLNLSLFRPHNHCLFLCLHETVTNPGYKTWMLQ